MKKTVVMNLRPSGTYDMKIVVDALTSCVLDLISWSIDDGVVVINNGNEAMRWTYTGLTYDDAEWLVEKSHNNGNHWREIGMYRVPYGNMD